MAKAAAAEVEEETEEKEKPWKFKVLASTHDEDGVTYQAGVRGRNVLYSEHRLDLMFQNKFKLLNPPASAEDDDFGDDEQGDEDPDLNLPLLPGPEERIRAGKKGPKLPSRIPIHGAPPNDAASRKAVRKVEEREPEDEESTEDEEGTDVTSDFEGAEDAKLTVRKVGSKYNLHGEDGLENKSPLSKKEAKKFIAELSAE